MMRLCTSSFVRLLLYLFTTAVDYILPDLLIDWFRVKLSR